MLSDARVSRIIQLRGNKFSEEFVRSFDKEWTETVEKFKRRTDERWNKELPRGGIVLYGESSKQKDKRNG